MKSIKFSQTYHNLLDLISFVILISLYVIYHTTLRLRNKFSRSKRIVRPKAILYHAIVNKLDSVRSGSISRMNLIELSMHNMIDKKARTWITMGGMALGIGLIVLLVSIGYGLEQMVISQVTRLDELKQADVVPGLSEDLTLTESSIADFKQIAGVAEVLPVISAVGHIKYNNSETDMAVYGVTSKYLIESAIKPSSGEIFNSDELTINQTNQDDKSKSINQRQDNESQDISINLQDDIWYRVREQADPNSPILGYTRKIADQINGKSILGGEFIWEDKTDNHWIETSVPLWDKQACEGEEACENGQYLPQLDSGSQKKVSGYLAQIALTIDSNQTSEPTKSTQQVLGESSDGSLPIVEIATLSAQIQDKNVKIVPVGGRLAKELVINKSALSVLGINENESIGTKIAITFVILGEHKTEDSSKIESLETEYTIIGVIPDDNTPQLYVPFIDLRSLGVENFSQIKIIASDKDSLAQIRTSIESSGFGTTSVVDTVGQIDKLFTSIRAFLAIMGIVALSVAALGMFNTLTVSLLERTHEVGLMKAIGMKSSEVKELFMTESMIMGFFGGILGLILGILAGLVISIILSIFALAKGGGFLNISYVPIPFALLIIAVSLLVGVGTGYIPARRATRISALDALRYE